MRQSVQFGHESISVLLINNGANVNDANETGLTLLITAVVKNNLPMVSLLLKKGAEVNARSQQGWTALIIADSKGFKDIVKLLHSGRV